MAASPVLSAPPFVLALTCIVKCVKVLKALYLPQQSVLRMVQQGLCFAPGAGAGPSAATTSAAATPFAVLPVLKELFVGCVNTKRWKDAGLLLNVAQEWLVLLPREDADDFVTYFQDYAMGNEVANATVAKAVVDMLLLRDTAADSLDPLPALCESLRDTFGLQVIPQPGIVPAAPAPRLGPQ